VIKTQQVAGDDNEDATHHSVLCKYTISVFGDGNLCTASYRGPSEA